MLLGVLGEQIGVVTRAEQVVVVADYRGFDGDRVAVDVGLVELEAGPRRDLLKQVGRALSLAAGAGVGGAPRGNRDEVDGGRLAVGGPVECRSDHVADGLAKGCGAFDRDDDPRLAGRHRPVTPSGVGEGCPNVILAVDKESWGRLKTILISAVEPPRVSKIAGINLSFAIQSL